MLVEIDNNKKTTFTTIWERTKKKIASISLIYYIIEHTRNISIWPAFVSFLFFFFCWWHVKCNTVVVTIHKYKKKTWFTPTVNLLHWIKSRIVKAIFHNKTGMEWREKKNNYIALHITENFVQVKVNGLWLWQCENQHLFTSDIPAIYEWFELQPKAHWVLRMSVQRYEFLFGCESTNQKKKMKKKMECREHCSIPKHM